MELTDYFWALPVGAIFHSHRDTRAQVTNTQICGSTESFAEARCRSYFAIFSPRESQPGSAGLQLQTRHNIAACVIVSVILLTSLLL